MAAAGRLATATGVYLGSVNLGSAGIFFYDKKCAEARQWRIPEATLCATALAGGWLGGMWAMQQFKHKTAKKSFQQKYNAAVAANIGGAALVASLPKARGQLLFSMKRLLRRLLGITCWSSCLERGERHFKGAGDQHECCRSGHSDSPQHFRSHRRWQEKATSPRYFGTYVCQAAATEAAPSAGLQNTIPGPRNVIQVLRERGLLQDTAGEGLEEAVIKGRVGDPSGRSLERPVLSEAEIDHNVAGIRSNIESFLQPEAGSTPLVINNLDWLGGMSFLDFLRDVGRFSRVNVMLSRDSVKTRLGREEGISFTEFTYQLLQGYDFLHLNQQHGVQLQIGGSDQMGNILTGLDLIRRSSSQDAAPCFGLCFPLLTRTDGTKMGKSAEGAVWLSPDKLSPFKFYQYLLGSVPDTDVIKFLRMLTFLPLTEIEEMEKAMQGGQYQPNSAQRRLAEEVTRMVHGETGLQQALKATQALAPGKQTQLDAAALEAIAEDAPTASLPRDQVVGAGLADIIATTGMQPSKAAARRMIKGGGVRINNEKVSEETQCVTEDDLIEGRLLLLATGKKNKLVLRIN
ncbi:hypothetical protein WJX84_008773 [Apatococcus fuscideae]|uniref:Tyrosine--tRNA ligase n=1 Tax=Apatococcus fuscideae TaxID=2026836 RepID=A0AAW1T9X2_9CHLO